VNVELRVTPLREGVLYVEGLLWNVMGAVQGFHSFALPMRQVTFPIIGGRRRKPELQVDPSLVIPVGPAMPLLAVSIPQMPVHMHHSEVVATCLRLHNNGASALHKVCLRLSHPGFIALAPAGGGRRVEQCYSHTWNEGYINLSLTLSPGERVELPLWIRGTLEGRHTLGFLIAYECVVVTSPVPHLKQRIAFLSFPLLVTPLFSIKVFTRPSSTRLSDSLLGIELQDKQQIIPGLTGISEYAEISQMDIRTIQVQLSEVSVLSQMWAIAPLEEPQQQHPSLHLPLREDATVPFPYSNAPPLPDQYTLRAYESLVVFVRVTNLPDSFERRATNSHRAAVIPEGVRGNTHRAIHQMHQPLHASQSANSLLLQLQPHHSRVPLGDSSVSSADPFISHLLHMEKALLMEEEKQTLIVNPAAQLADVGAINRMDLVFAWKSADGLRRGVYHAPGLSCMKKAASACSLKVLLSFPRVIHHDFTHGWLDVPVFVRIRNTLEDAPVTFSFETLAPEEEFDTADRVFRTHTSPALRARYIWYGNTKCKVSELGAGESCVVQLFAAFAAPGVYNLNRFRFTFEVVSGSEPRVFFFPLQHLIHINQHIATATVATLRG
jgi:hypothetical protein